MRIYSQQVSALLPNSETWPIKQWQKMARFIISRHNIGNKTNSNKHCCYVTLHSHFKEDEHHLWLAVDSLNNLAACETFAFLSGKLVEPILFETTQLKQLLQSLAPKANQIEEQTSFIIIQKTKARLIYLMKMNPLSNY